MKRYSAMILAGLILLLLISGCGPDPVDKRPGWIPREPREEVITIETVEPGEIQEHLHVPSPDWRDQIVYFIMTDRFDDGNPENSDQGKGEYDPSLNSHYSGGDLAGILNNLDYIKGLGMTAVWITPPVANQWYDNAVNYGGYHGYWGEHFMKVDKHMGTLKEYQELSANLHRNGMYLLQDIVPNHTGNFFTYTGASSASNPTRNYLANEQSVPVSAPTQYPFNLNNPHNKKDLGIGAYHWTGPITDYNNRSQRLKYQLSDLDDINTESPLVRQVLRESYGYWIDKAGVDGFRIDTVKFVDHDFWNDFHYSADPDYPGILNLARSLGKEDFITFGEAWIGSKPYEEQADRDIAAYLGTDEKPEMVSVLNFTLNQEVRSVFAAGKPTSQLSYRLESLYRNYPDPTRLFTFIDNHDMDRFLNQASYKDMKQALLYLFTAPGVPVIYYGTEQQFTETRQAMFANGFNSGGKDHFLTGNDSYQFIRELSRLRKSSPLFSRGEYVTLKDSNSGAGVLAYLREYGGEQALIILNTASSEILVDRLATGAAPGTVYKTVFSAEGDIDSLVIGIDGSTSFSLPAKSAMVLIPEAETKVVAAAEGQVGISNLEEGTVLRRNRSLSGTVSGVKALRVVIDGNLSQGFKAEVSPDGTWNALLEAERLGNGSHSLVVFGWNDNGEMVLSKTVPFEIELDFVSLLNVEDPVGDDAGPEGRYLYPLDISFNRQMDIERVEVLRGGTNLQIVMTMADEISTVWSPLNGFDHVTYYIYIDNPQKSGARVMPFQNGEVPAEMDWDYMAMLGGWTLGLYSSENSGPKAYGDPVAPGPVVEVDRGKRQVAVVLEGAALGNPASLSGFKIYLTTWDYDGLESANRPLHEEPDAYIFGGGDGSEDTLIMDDTVVFILP